jgi:hypothetical protein
MPMTPEVRQKWTAAWREAQKAKDERRKANREKWAKRRDWSDDNEHKADIGTEDNASGNGDGSSSLAKMRAIMADSKVALYRRLEAAEVVLSYELGPGAGVGVDPEAIAAASFRFLRAVTDDSTTPEALRFRALKSIVAVENARAQAKSSAVTNAEKRVLLLKLVNAERISAIRASGNWPEAVKTDQWALKNGDTFDWPLGWPGEWPWPPATFSAALEQGHDVTAFREQLRAIRATNRLDAWEKFIESTHQI